MRRLLVSGLRSAAAVALVVSVSLTGAYAKEAATAVGEAKAEAKAVAGARIDVNSATQAELEKLPGIGKVGAKKIIAGRPYASVARASRRPGFRPRPSTR